MTYDEMAKKAEKAGKTESLTVAIKQWKQEGDFLIGKVLEVRPFEGGKFESTCNSYLLDTDAGRVTTVLGASVDKSLEKIDITNHVVKITYQGKIQLEDGRQCNKFEILDITHAA